MERVEVTLERSMVSVKDAASRKLEEHIKKHNRANASWRFKEGSAKSLVEKGKDSRGEEIELEEMDPLEKYIDCLWGMEKIFEVGVAKAGQAWCSPSFDPVKAGDENGRFDWGQVVKRWTSG